MLVFVPLAPDALAAWARDGVREVAGFAATASFRAAFGLADPDSEDADLTLLEVAGLAGLLAHGVRLVAVCRADAAPAEPADFGAVAAGSVSWEQVESIFVDDATGRARASDAAASLVGADLDAAWEADAVADLLRTTELLWHGPSEWAALA